MVQPVPILVPIRYYPALANLFRIRDVLIWIRIRGSV
jgi:hypothetical protein